MKQGRASATARLIAGATVMRGEEADGAPIGAAAWCARCLSTRRGDRLLLASVRLRAGRAWWRMVESVCLAGIVSHWMRRKREIDAMARRGAAEGFRQLVVIGAGLDSLAFRAGEEGQFERVVSADHPATLAVVRRALGERRDAQDSGAAALMTRETAVELVALDLLESNARDALVAARTFDPAMDTLIVIEGVLMYLPVDVVARVLGSLSTLGSGRLRLVVSWMVAEEGREVGFRGQGRLVSRWLQRTGEPMLWASTVEALPAFLEGLGWRVSRMIDLSIDDGSGRATARGLRGERLLVAEHEACM